MREKATLCWNCALLLAFIFLTGCAQKPETIVEKYLEYTFLDDNGEEAYKLLSSEDQFYEAEEVFTSKLRKENMLNKKILQKNASSFKYEIIDSKTSGDTTQVRVRLTRPNAEEILSNILSHAMVTALSPDEEDGKIEHATKKFNELLHDNAVESEIEEKEFTVIKENNKYRLYLNLGRPYKLEKIKQQVKELKKAAADHEKRLDFSRALDNYNQIKTLDADKEALKRITNIRNIKENTVELGKSRKFGHLEFTPEKIELRTINLMRMNWHLGRPVQEKSNSEYLVLTFKATNTSQDQKFCYGEKDKYYRENVVRDNIGNVLNEIGPSYDIYRVEDNDFKKLGPGESATYTVVCESPVDVAEDYLWEIELYTDNQKNKQKAYIRFSKEDINGQEGVQLANK
ncbi:hypothetical protein RCC89_00250 [Cytophagaceae bacterium ABcell3]|nr:hypothetical protein RCC89_00250 [Cytophagaceae bacterium ABcell3]